MLSVLIPTYFYNTLPLVQVLEKQCRAAGITFEILVFDDGSRAFFTHHELIDALPYCQFKLLEKNVGRSKIRNLLAQAASYNYLLFLDADVMPASANFIREYVKWIDDNEKVVSGGLLYREVQPPKGYTLRWKYGRFREAIPAHIRRARPYQRLLASNFLISKRLFQKIGFEENIPNLRREDTLFSYQLLQNHAHVVHIDNPVYHLGIDQFEQVISKEKQSLEGLFLLLQNEQITAEYTKISLLYQFLIDMRLRKPVAWLFNLLEAQLLKHLAGKNPFLLVFDFYRLGYLCTLKN